MDPSWVNLTDGIWAMANMPHDDEPLDFAIDPQYGDSWVHEECPRLFRRFTAQSEPANPEIDSPCRQLSDHYL